MWNHPVIEFVLLVLLFSMDCLPSILNNFGQEGVKYILVLSIIRQENCFRIFQLKQEDSCKIYFLRHIVPFRND